MDFNNVLANITQLGESEEQKRSQRCAIPFLANITQLGESEEQKRSKRCSIPFLAKDAIK